MHRSILGTTPFFRVCWHPPPLACRPGSSANPGGRRGQEEGGSSPRRSRFLPEDGHALPSCRVRRDPLFTSAPKPPLPPATPALPSHKRIPVIPLERQSLIMPPSLSDETRKLAPFRNDLPGAKLGLQSGEGAGCRGEPPALKLPCVPCGRASSAGPRSGPTGVSPRCPGLRGLVLRCPTRAPAAPRHVVICIALRPSQWGQRPEPPAPPRAGGAALRTPPRGPARLAGSALRMHRE